MNNIKWSIIAALSVSTALVSILVLSTGGTLKEIAVFGSIYLVAFVALGKASENFTVGGSDE